MGVLKSCVEKGICGSVGGIDTSVFTIFYISFKIEYE